jgi:hypothetical protein
MENTLYTDIDIFLAVERKYERMQDDLYLSNFALAWRGLPSDSTGLRDGNVSQAYYEAYIKAMKQDGTTATGSAQGQFSLPASGIQCAFDPDNGNLVLYTAMGGAVILKEDLPALIAGINGPRPEDTVQGTLSPAQSSSNLSPQLKRRMRQNIKALEKWAVASSKSFPK